jgi:hypothetical protein
MLKFPKMALEKVSFAVHTARAVVTDAIFSAANFVPFKFNLLKLDKSAKLNIPLAVSMIVFEGFERFPIPLQAKTALDKFNSFRFGIFAFKKVPLADAIVFFDAHTESLKSINTMLLKS